MHYPSNLATYDEIKNEFIHFAEGRKKKKLQIVTKCANKGVTDEMHCNIEASTRKEGERLELKSSKVLKEEKEKIRYF